MNKLLVFLIKKLKSFNWKLNDVIYSVQIKKAPTLKQGKTVLIYHGIDIHDNRQFNTKFISKNRLFNQLSWLKKHTEIVTFDHLLKKTIPAQKHQVCLTFDDGFENNYSLLFPILKQLNIPATIFITPIQLHGYDILWPDLLDLASPYMPTPFIFQSIIFTKKRREFYHPNGMRFKKWLSLQNNLIKNAFYEAMKSYQAFKTAPSLDTYWKLLSPSQLQEMAQHSLITIGAHGSWHNNLGEISLHDAIKELQASKEYLENITQTSVNTLAYPDGSYSRDLIEAATNMGYKYQFAVDYTYPEDEQDERIINRLGINPFISWNNQITAIGKGKY
jgi:peptidoglycan/xylan/chitin deacetylase (PgdA/CDA1 family)